jgi:hypothetical protein
MSGGYVIISGPNGTVASYTMEEWQRRQTTISTDDPCDDWPIAPSWTLERRNHIVPRYDRQPPQAFRCHHGTHHWTGWSAYVPAPVTLAFMAFPTEPPQPTPIEAYRWRYCECGASERQSFGDHTIQRYDPKD